MVTVTKQIIRRPAVKAAGLTGLHPVMQRLFAARGIGHVDQLTYTLSNLLPHHTLKGIDQAANRLAKAIITNEQIVIIGDYDADGATSTALAVRALHALGAKQVNYLVPNRFRNGYGLSPPLVDIAKTRYAAKLIITVDNGIASISGVARANELGIAVLITDHHLPGETLPAAAAIVNPNQPDDPFPSKQLAGVGVIFYLMAATRGVLDQRDWFSEQGREKPSMAPFLDLVALGTVADMVALDRNNRILVQQGLQRIRAGHTIAGILALIEVANRDERRLQASDLGFALAPRLNAAGRLEDMSVGIACLLTDDKNRARELATMLNQLNGQRQQIEQTMQHQALESIKSLHLGQTPPSGIALFDQRWHQGVIGIVAGRVKEQFHRPVVAFAADGEGKKLKGSARSIPGLHIRDLLATIANRHPNLIDQFGGHAAAAGLTLPKSHFEQFSTIFADQVDQMLTPDQREARLMTDGELMIDEITLSLAQQIVDAGPWGQAFPEPLFDGQFTLLDQRLLKGKHLKMVLQRNEQQFEAIAFFIDESQWPNYDCREVYLVYRLQINEYLGRQRLQLLVEQLTSVQDIRH